MGKRRTVMHSFELDMKERSDREQEYWRRVFDEIDAAPATSPVVGEWWREFRTHWGNREAHDRYSAALALHRAELVRQLEEEERAFASRIEQLTKMWQAKDAVVAERLRHESAAGPLRGELRRSAHPEIGVTQSYWREAFSYLRNRSEEFTREEYMATFETITRLIEEAEALRPEVLPPEEVFRRLAALRAQLPAAIERRIRTYPPPAIGALARVGHVDDVA